MPPPPPIPKGGNPFAVLGVVSAAAVGAIVYVHYDQKQQRKVRW